MGNIFTKFFGKFKMDDDIDYDDDDFEDEDYHTTSRERTSIRSYKKDDDSDSYQMDSFFGAKKRTVEEKSTKIVPLKKNPISDLLQVSILRPKNIKEACKACDYLADGKAVVLNLEGIDEAEAQRIMDFVFGSMYAINGKYSQISSYIFIFVSQAGELDSDLEESVKSLAMDNAALSNEFEIPIIRRDF